MRSESLADAGRRIALLRALFVCLFLLLAARAAHLTVVSERGAFRGKGQLEGVMILPATRGLIVDRNGVEMALSTQASSVYMLPSDFDGNAKNLDALANVLNIPPKALRERLRGRKRFTFVRRWVSDEVATRIEALDLPGVGIISEPRRAYPADELASSLLGFANIDGIGVRGIEAQENEWLTGTPVRTPVERDARGRLLARELVAPVSSSGGDVALTIDMAMQAEAETALRDAIKKRGALGGFVVTMDPRTGEILALAESPGFNPNQFRTVDYKKTGSRAFHDALEPGSVMKAFLVAAALDAGAIKRNQRFDTGDGTMQLPGKKIRDHHPYGVIDPSKILQVSSNIGTVMIAQKLGPEAYYNALLRFGFGRHSGSGFPSESNGLLRGWKNWKPIDHATVSYGQGIGVTAVQLAAAMCALASD
ncbi:MAG: penicillin-binding protein 2, partial [Myxococcota bacterium]|nr:penicillin-binding protein 2 [Myxococcota bacterium]